MCLQHDVAKIKTCTRTCIVKLSTCLQHDDVARDEDLHQNVSKQLQTGTQLNKKRKAGPAGIRLITVSSSRHLATEMTPALFSFCLI